MELLATSAWLSAFFCLALYLRLPDSKTGAKVIPLGAAALEVLGDVPRIEGNPYVLPGLEGRHFVGLQKAWERIRKRAGLDDVRLHDLRHSFASVAVAGGDSLYLVGKVLGHQQARTTERYAHIADDPLKAVADKTFDQGGFHGGAREISHSGNTDLPMGPDSITGYSIINAESLEEAEQIAQANPFIASIRVYEISAG